MILRNYYTKILEAELIDKNKYKGLRKRKLKKERFTQLGCQLLKIGCSIEYPIYYLTGKIFVKFTLDCENEKYNTLGYLHKKRDEIINISEKLGFEIVQGKYKEVMPDDDLLKRIEINTILEIKELLSNEVLND